MFIHVIYRSKKNFITAQTLTSLDCIHLASTARESMMPCSKQGYCEGSFSSVLGNVFDSDKELVKYCKRDEQVACDFTIFSWKTLIKFMSDVISQLISGIFRQISII
uniref:Uncharacterized protein n=1 Tax=Romanomermis culicivorax TaxID=13658 RepID=A0A915JI57_ROMCU